MTKPEWQELHEWFQKPDEERSEKEIVCSLGTLTITDDGMPSLLAGILPVKSDDQGKCLCGQQQTLTLSAGFSIKTELNGRNYTLTGKSEKPAKVTIMGFYEALKGLDKKLKAKVKKHSHEFLRLSQVEQENAIIVECNNDICLIDAQGNLYTIESCDSVKEIKLASVSIYVG